MLKNNTHWHDAKIFLKLRIYLNRDKNKKKSRKIETKITKLRKCWVSTGKKGKKQQNLRNNVQLEQNLQNHAK